LIDGVDIIFIGPPIILAAVAVLIAVWQLKKHGIKRAAISLVLVLLCGSVFLFMLFVIVIGTYYAGGGH
jgi:hypothetical protein